MTKGIRALKLIRICDPNSYAKQSRDYENDLGEIDASQRLDKTCSGG